MFLEGVRQHTYRNRFEKAQDAVGESHSSHIQPLTLTTAVVYIAHHSRRYVRNQSTVYLHRLKWEPKTQYRKPMYILGETLVQSMYVGTA